MLRDDDYPAGLSFWPVDGQHAGPVARSLASVMRFTFLISGLATLLAAFLVAARWALTGVLVYHFLLWNLFLAWLPFLAAALLVRWRRRPLRRTLAGIGWLLFFPNAPYLITDLVHLRAHPGITVWYDLILLLVCAGTGLLLGFGSLSLLHDLVSARAGHAAGWLFAALTLMLGSVGVYLGRFQRWNSWQALTQPKAILADLWPLLREPWQYRHVYAFIALFAALLGGAYVVLQLLPRQTGVTSSEAID